MTEKKPAKPQPDGMYSTNVIAALECIADFREIATSMEDTEVWQLMEALERVTVRVETPFGERDWWQQQVALPWRRKTDPIMPFADSLEDSKVATYVRRMLSLLRGIPVVVDARLHDVWRKKLREKKEGEK